MSTSTWHMTTTSPRHTNSVDRSRAEAGFQKVPEVVVGFWLIKILATTLGETGGDALSMSLHLGYFVSTVILALLFAGVVAIQLRSERFRPFLYWTVVIASTTVGTTLADLATRSLGIGYVGGSLLLAALLAGSLAAWSLTLGTVSVQTIRSRRAEGFYWLTILFSQTLGTALGDFAADDGGLGYGGGALVFAAALVVTVAFYALTDLSRVLLFWTAFILTRPLGATIGDFLDKPIANGGLALDRFQASAGLVVLIATCILLLPQQSSRHSPR